MDIDTTVGAALAEEIITRAEGRAQASQFGYRGVVTPQEAWSLVAIGSARLLDVRSQEELTLVGRVPGAVEIELKRYPDWRPNPAFLSEVGRKFSRDDAVLLLCRSAARSHEAAALLAAEGYGRVFNILEGFEGDKNADGQRTVSGWKVRGLPWRH